MGWMGEIDKYATDRVKKLLVGNKCDLFSKRAVAFDEANEFALEIGIRLIETSAKNAHDVEEAFQTLAADIKHSFVTRQRDLRQIDDGRASVNASSHVGGTA